MIAALFVETDGVYFGLPGVDPWDERRDARLYDGDDPVIAHSPCQRWGRYWYGGPALHAKGRRLKKGADGGCFASALANVRRCGGVLEHPEASHAWAAFGLNAPPRSGGWIVADFLGGWTCCVEQGHYGHRARKATWLYAFGVELPSLKWGPSASGIRLDRGFHSKEERARHRLFTRPPKNMAAEDRAARREWLKTQPWLCPERMGKRERARTPIPFRDLLISIAQTAHRGSA